VACARAPIDSTALSLETSLQLLTTQQQKDLGKTVTYRRVLTKVRPSNSRFHKKLKPPKPPPFPGRKIKGLFPLLPENQGFLDLIPAGGNHEVVVFQPPSPGTRYVTWASAASCQYTLSMLTICTSHNMTFTGVTLDHV
jgi:hypothetical protein